MQNSPIEDLTFLRKVFETLGSTASSCYDTRNDAELAAELDEIRTACLDYSPESISGMHETTDASCSILIMLADDEAPPRRFSTVNFCSATIARIYCDVWKISMDGEELAPEPEPERPTDSLETGKKVDAKMICKVLVQAGFPRRIW